MPLKFRANDIHRTNDIFSRYQGLERALDDLYNAGVIPSKEYNKLVSVAKKYDSVNVADERDWGALKGVSDFWNRVNKATSKSNDALVYANEVEGGGDSYAILNPKNIRSRFAAFNPAKRDSADLLAGIAPWAMPIGATLLGGSFLLPPEEY